MMRQSIPALLLFAALAVSALGTSEKKTEPVTVGQNVAEASIDRLYGYGRDKSHNADKGGKTGKTMRENPAFKAYDVDASRDYASKEESDGTKYEQQQAPYGSKEGQGGSYAPQSQYDSDDEQKQPDGQEYDAYQQQPEYASDSTQEQEPYSEQHQESEYSEKDAGYGEAPCKDKENCPTPQQADDVRQVYLAHGKFVWRELAAQSDRRTGVSAKKSSFQGDQQGKARIHRIKAPILAQLAKQQSKLQGKQKAVVQKTPAKTPEATQTLQTQQADSGELASLQSTQGALRAAAQTAVGIATKPPAPVTTPQQTKPQATVSVAAVDNLQHLWATSKDQTGYGFNGVRAEYIPSDQALAVGPHPIDPEAVIAIHGVQGFFEIFMVTQEDGKPVSTVTATKIHMDDLMAATGIDLTNLYGFNPQAWYDPKEKRYVLMWATGMKSDAVVNDADEPKVAYPLFVAVSCSSNPLGDWVVWALDTVPQIAPGNKFCAGQPLTRYAANTPQASFGDQSISVGLGVYCGDFSRDDGHSFLSVLYVYSKEALYAKVPPSGVQPTIYAAMYLGSTSWYRSVPPSGQALVEDAYKPFNSFITPARPQEKGDVEDRPLFVMKISDTMMSIATITGEPLNKMCNKETAPKIVATVVGKGGDFSNLAGHPEGIPAMPQPGTFRTLDAGDVGSMNRTSELRTYWATHHKGLLYFTTSEYWGSGTIRMPSIYWSIVQPGPGLCAVSRLEWGVVASQDGLALTYPVIAAKGQNGAVLAFAYSGAGTISDGNYPAYPGVATAHVGESYGYGLTPGDGIIQIVERGPGVLTRESLSDPQYYGTYSAAQVWDGKMWFAVDIPEAVEGQSDLKHGSWVSATDL